MRVTGECSWCISEETYNEVKQYINNDIIPNIKMYGLTGNHCTSTAAKIANKAGISVNPYVTFDIPSKAKVGNHEILFWSDPQYNKITFALPDRMQDVMKKAGGNNMRKSCR